MPISKIVLTTVSLLVALVVSNSSHAKTAVSQPDRLVILSTTDVRGKTGPCGCHIPKGGLSRQASYADSIKAHYGQVLWVDNGGYFPEDVHADPASFLMGAMKKLGLDAVGIGERDLRFGVAYLLGQAKSTGLPMVCSNLIDRGTQKPLVAPSLVKQVGAIKVGVFALIDPKADLGPARDSLAILDPTETARQTIAALHRSGAQVVVLLSQLGKMESEDLVSAVDGIDAVVVGHNTPVFQAGRLIKNTVACYGGEQGQYMCRTELTLDAKRHPSARQAQAVMLSPEVGENLEVQKLVKAFEDDFNEKVRQQEAARPPKQTLSNSPDSSATR